MRLALQWALLMKGLSMCSWALAQPNQLQNLGPNINSAFNESSPVITPAGEVLYFWSLDRPGGMGYHDIYVSNRDTGFTQTAQFGLPDSVYRALVTQSGGFTPARNLGAPVNDALANIVLSCTPDGNSLLIYKRATRPSESDLAIARRVGGVWTPPRNIRIEGFENPGETALTATMSANGKAILLALNNQAGNQDLYISFQDDSGRHKTPQSLGPIINTAQDEITPFLAPDGLTLYFSSAGHNSMGGYDVFMTRRLDETWQNWSPVRSLGPAINTIGDDYYFKFPLQADWGYLVSTAGPDALGGKDIFRVRIPDAVKPQPVFRVAGKVVNKDTNQPLGARIKYVRLRDVEEVGTATSDPATGEYQLLLPAGERYAVVADAQQGYIATSEFLDGTTARNFQLVERNLLLSPLAVGQVVTLNNLFFDVGKASIRPESEPELTRIVTLMNLNPGLAIEVDGHTDNTGSAQSNEWLSGQRAAAVVKHLMENGIAPERLKSSGSGCTKPVAENTTEAGRQKNRRVEIRIMGNQP